MKDDKEIRKKFKEYLNKKNPPYEKNLLKDFKRVQAILNGSNPPPYEVEIQPSSLCNLKCKHCFGRNYERLPNLMGVDEIKKIATDINNFKENGLKIEVAKFCGTTGDPFVNAKTTVEGIKLFKEAGKKIVVYTNGLYIDTTMGGDFYDELSKISRLNLSLDAGSEEVFTNLKGRQGFKRIINNLESIVEKRSGNNTDLNIVVSYVIGKENYKDIVNAARIVKENGADEISYRVDFTDLNRIRNLSDIIIENINNAKEYSDDNFKVISAYSDDDIKSKDVGDPHEYKCFTTGIWASVGSDCNLYACGHRTYSGVKSYGNLLENSFRDLWNSKERLESIKNLPDKYCEMCSPFPIRANEFITFLSEI